MITTRTAKQCGQADFGWLQARYTFSFGHYFDPKLLGYASLRVLNQEVLAPGASFQPRTYPKVDILNLILEGEAEYRDSDGNHVQAKAGEALLISTQPGVSYSEHNLSKEQLANANAAVAGCLSAARKPAGAENRYRRRDRMQLLASPDGSQRQPPAPPAGMDPPYRSWRKASSSTCNCTAPAPTCSRFTVRCMRVARKEEKQASNLRRWRVYS